MLEHPHEWNDLAKELRPPLFILRTWKHSVICKDSRIQCLSYNDIARHLYPDSKGTSHDEQHEPGRDQVRDDLVRFERLEADYQKIAFANDYTDEFAQPLGFPVR